ncbi:MAG TPA: hypothetical protein VGN42_28785 [Pirellulales bacterium]|nr:hypothetical protein [Pirellulales bacterium]
MEDTSTPSINEGRWSEEFARTLAAQRERAHDFAGGHRRRLSQLEAELASQLAQASEELARGRRAAAEEQAAIAQTREQLEAAQAKLRLDERSVGEQRREYEADVEELARQRQRVQEKLADLERQREAIEDEQSQTKGQRRRIAQEFKEQREKHLREIEQQRQDIERAQGRLGEAGALAAELAELRQACAGLEKRLAELGGVEERCADLERQLAELGAVEQRCADLERQLAERPATSDDGPQIAALTQERDRLDRQLTEAKTRLAEAERKQSSAGAGDGKLAEELADMQRRYQLAMDDVRELKKKNADLEKQRGGGGGHSAPSGPPSDGMDWEAQKRRMLAALEANENDDEGDEEEKAERLRIRDVIAKTEAVLAAKDQEIADLKQLLDSQSGNIGEMAIGAQAIAEMLNQDEVVTAERERLLLLQKEWEEKLRQAEIEMSVQRAKIARERAEIEERQRQFQQQQAEHGGDETSSTDGGKGKKPPRGRWLTRLGLKEQDEE